MITEEPLVSYVIGVRNMQNTVGKTIESILHQDYPKKEIIVINDGSDDDTEKILKKYPIKFITTEKIGISNARNLGYKSSNGEFIAFTDADCELDPMWTKKIIEGFKDEKVGLIGGITIFKTDNTFSSIYRSLEFSRRQKKIKTRVVWAGGPGSMFRKSVLDEIGGFNPKWIHGEDAEISFITIEHGYKILRINEAITYHIPEKGFWKLVKKGKRDAKAYVRVTNSYLKTSLRNKFNTTWYFPFDMIILPFFYAFLLISLFLIPLIYLFNFFIDIFIFRDIIVPLLMPIWINIFFFIVIFVFIYCLFPSIQVAIYSKERKIKGFFGSYLLHHTRCFAWGLGLLIGIKDIILRKN